MSNKKIPPIPGLLPCPSPICNFFNIHRRKINVNENYVPRPLSGPPGAVSPYNNYALTLAHISKTTCTIFLKFWDVVPNKIKVTNLH